MTTVDSLGAVDPPPGSPTSKEGPIASIQSAAIVIIMLVGAYVAFGSSDGGSTSTMTPAGAVAGLAVVTTDLVNAVTDAGEATKATGGYVPGTGIVVTVEIDELPGTEIEAWATDVVGSAGARLDDLPADEAVVFMVDIARSTRTSRLVRLDPGTLADQGTWSLREAPATSTAPLTPEFESVEEADADG